MTTPNQSVPSTVETLLGIGAFQIGGGSTNFGQNLDENFVNGLVKGPASLLLDGVITDIPAALAKLAEFLATLPFEALKMFEGIIPGKTATDFLDIPTSITSILGSILTDPLGSIVTVLKQIMDIFGGLLVTPVNAAVQGVKDWFSGITGQTQGLNSLGQLNGANIIGEVLDVLIPGLTGSNGLFNGLFGGITKLGGTGRSRDEVNTAVSGQADTVIGTASTMEQILAALGSGTPDADDFERTSATDLGANWGIYQTGTGVLATPNGHDASHTGSGNVEYVARKTDKQASTDHQTVTMVLASSIPTWPAFTPFPYGGNNDLWLRMTAFTTFAARTGLRFRINSQAPYQATWFIHWVSAGTETQLATGTLSIPAAGASIAWEAGVGGDMKAYQARLNGSPVAAFTDSVDRGLGTANRFRGFGGKGTSGIGLPQGTATLKQWTAQG